MKGAFMCKYSVSVKANGTVKFLSIEGETSYECLTKLKAELKEKYPKDVVVESMILIKD
jgi:hypothetical protein